MLTKTKIPTPLRIAYGFAPFFVQGLLVPSIGGRWATMVGLGLALPPVLSGLRQGRARLLEVVAAIWFAALVLAGTFGYAPLASDGAAIVFSLLALVAWGSLLAGRPFTEDYARDDWPESYWRDPGFRAINRLVTAIWAGIFTLHAVLLKGVPDAAWASNALLVAKVTGIGSSIWLPEYLARRRVRRRLAESEPEPWPLPNLTHPRPPSVPWDVAIVGAGIGALSAGALLAKAGKRVLICEAHDRPGGYCSSWTRTLGRIAMRRTGTPGTFVFDAGVHDVSGLHAKGGIRALLRRLGVEDRLRWLPMEHEFHDPAGVLRLGVGRQSVTDALARRHPQSADGIAAFLCEMEAVFHDLYGEVDHTNGIPRMPRDVERLLAWPRHHPAACRWMDQPFDAMLAAFVTDPGARRTLSMLTGYLGDRPHALTVRQMAPIFGILFEGGHYPAGGSQKLADLLATVIIEHGGEVRLRTPVSRILVEGGAAAGLVLAGGAVERSRVVVGGGDVKRTFLDLVGAEHLPPETVDATITAEPSCSAFMVNLAVDMVPDGAPLKSLRDAEGRHLGISVPSLADPSLCPPGHAVVTLLQLVPQDEAAPWDRLAADYRRAKTARGDAMIALAETALPGLSGHILYRQDASPRTFARYTRASGGAIYGLALGGYRPHRRTPLPGLFLAGHGTPIGAGVEAVAIAGMMVAEDLGAFAAA